MPKPGNRTDVQRMEVASTRAGQRLDNFLSAQLKGAPRSLIYRLIRTGQVRVNGGRAKPDTRLQAGDEVRIPPVSAPRKGALAVPDSAIQSIARTILHDDEDLLVVNKPSGMAVHAGSGLNWGLIDVLRALRPQDAPELVHRLDRETSGCLLVAKNTQVARQLGDQFRKRETEKRYLCLMDGRMPEARLEVDQPLQKAERSGERYMRVAEAGKTARTAFSELQVYGGRSFTEAVPHTGRTHQIRAHAAFLELPLAGDRRYLPKGRIEAWHNRGLERLFLHAHFLSFLAPSGELLEVHAPLPDDLRDVLNRL